MKNMDRNKRLSLLGVGIVAFALVVFGLWPRSQPSLVIVDGVQYQLLSYGTVESKLSSKHSAKTFEAYVLTIAYPKEDQKLKGTTRGTVMVPKFAVKRDFSLPPNTVIWETVDLEGKTYGVARWNPAHDVPAVDSPTLVPEPPLTRT